MNIRSEACVQCKGYRYLCSLSSCPILERIRSHFLTFVRIKGDYVSGSSPPSVLVGEYGYPKVRVMYNVPPDVYKSDAKIYEDPIGWWGRLDLNEIVKLRTSMVASTVRTEVYDPWKLYEKEISLASISSEPVDSEVKLSSKPRPYLNFNAYTKPVGLAADAESIKITSNPSLNKSVEKAIYDDLKAYKAVYQLYKSGVDIYTIIKAFSLGLLGEYRQRKLVPTRWSITAVDSILGSYFRNEVKGCPSIDSVLAFKGAYLYNRFVVILAPGPLEISWVEAWRPHSLWNVSNEAIIFEVYEDHRGKWSAMDGGYVAARLPVLEYLSYVKRQARVFIFREIEPRYVAPVGNWHIRETVKNILRSQPTKYDDLSEALKNELKYLSVPIDRLIGKSTLYREIKQRRELTEFIKSV